MAGFASRRSRSLVGCGALALAIIAGPPGEASAQDSTPPEAPAEPPPAAPPAGAAEDPAAADALFKQAKALMAEGKVAEACPKFQASLELQRTLGTLMNLADCVEQRGLVATAHQRWGEAIAMAKESNDPRVTFATERRDAVAPRVPKLVLDVVRGPEELTISLAGKAVPPGRYGLPIEIDPGEAVVEVSRGDEVLHRQSVKLVEGQTQRAPVDLDAIAKAHPKKTTAQGPEPRPEQRIAGFVVLSVGLAAVASFAVLESVALAKRSEANDLGNCVDKNDVALCSPQGFDLVEEAGLLAEVGQWVGLGGLAVVGVGITLVLTAPVADEEAESAPKVTAVVPWLSPEGAGVSVGGRW